ncbi:MAG: LysR family transcriptional regulator [Halomonas sp.]|nr:LysR family transcriptional regulator [Halomonas sp.]
MNRNDLRRVDFHLLVVFETLMHERSVTHTAEKLFLGQPAVSAALARLRGLFNDVLFIRNGRTMEPTSRALEIYGYLHPALDSISQALSMTRIFDPYTNCSTFRIGLSDDVEFSLLPHLIYHLRYAAPNAVLTVRRVGYALITDMLNNNDISLGICYVRNLPASTKCTELKRIRHKVLRADSASEPLSIDAYCSRPHALVSFNGSLSDYVDASLAELGYKRQVVLVVPEFGCLGSLLSNTDIIATVPEHIATVLTAQGALRAEEVPFSVPCLSLSMVWNSAQDSDPAEIWLRSLVRSCFT